MFFFFLNLFGIVIIVAYIIVVYGLQCCLFTWDLDYKFNRTRTSEAAKTNYYSLSDRNYAYFNVSKPVASGPGESEKDDRVDAGGKK